MDKANRIILWSAAALSLIVVVFGIINFNAKPAPHQTASLINTISPLDWSQGDKEAKITLVEYSDFQCPACGSYYPLTKQIINEFGKEINFVYRHFPLTQIHANANLAARAAEAAGKQDKFWEMHDVLFEKQKEWSAQENSEAEKTFTAYAKQLNLDTKQFIKDLNSKEVREKVSNDYQSGVRSQVNGTPTFFLNGKKITNPRNYGDFRDVIKRALKENS